jgi:isoquinoline 1-oxidoreductase beta subunit
MTSTQSPIVKVSRRDFLKVTNAALGSGLVLGFNLHGLAQASGKFEPNAWVSIDTAGVTTITLSRSEMGQGVITGMPMMLAEELEADWSKVQVYKAQSNQKIYGSQNTGGSGSIRGGWQTLRRAGATAREMLTSAASQKWGVPWESCVADNGYITHPPTGRKLSYGELATAAAAIPVPQDPKLKDPEKFRIIGKPTKRLDVPSKVDGTAEFGIDVKVPGMLQAVAERCPVFGGKVVSFDATKAKAVPGVKDVLKVSDTTVAVVADSVWAAMQGRKALSVTWDEGPNAQLSSAALREKMIAEARQDGVEMRKEGAFAEGYKSAAKTLEASYELPFQDHAPMEPQNCTAQVKDGKCVLWAPTQVPNTVQADVARDLGIKPEDVTVNLTLLGGGFGRRLWGDYALEAARVSKAVNAPVKIQFTREDDIQHGFYRPMSIHAMKGAVNAEGWPVAWQHVMVSPSIVTQMLRGGQVGNGFDPQVQGQMTNVYAIPHLRLGYVMANTPVPVGWWRAVYHTQINLADECFVDELAALGGKDPLALRLHLLKDDRQVKYGNVSYSTARLRNVVQLAAEKAGWGKPAPSGRHRGLACCAAFGSYCALVTEVSLRGANFRVDRVVVAMDCGRPINPLSMEAQAEGSVVFGISALRSEITIERGRVKQSNFHNYPLMKMADMPKVEVHLVRSTEPPMGAGEPPVPLVAPAVANALFAATGKRIRRLPIKAGDLGVS